MTLAGEPPEPGTLWTATEEAWSQVVPDCGDLIAVADARHAYAVLRGLTSASGAMVAAATTSLPERLEAGRNYDYRYAWIRDQCYAGLAVAAHGPHPMLAGAVRFVTERLLADGPGADARVHGERVSHPRRAAAAAARLSRRGGAERELGARAVPARRVRRGAVAARRRGRHDMLGEDDWRAAEVAADAIEKRWQEPDAGIWELDNQRWAHSRLACVSGLRAIATAAGGGPAAGTGSGRRRPVELAGRRDHGQPGRLRAPFRAAGSGRRATSGWTPRCCCRSSGAAARCPTRGAWRRSRRCGAELAADGFVYRFRHDDRPLHKAEGAFLLCGFWMALVAHAHGNPVAAAHWFERNRSATGPAALYTEEYDVHQRQLRGTCRRRSCTPGCWSAR